MRDSELKIGMEVVINETVRHCVFGRVDNMIDNIGKRVVISSKHFFDRFGCYGFKIKGDCHSFLYAAENFSPVTSENKIIRWIDGVEYELIPTGRMKKTLDELYEKCMDLLDSPEICDYCSMNPNVTIVTAKIKGVTGVGIAKCSPEDEYNDKIGLPLATFRALGMEEEEKQLLELT